MNANENTVETIPAAIAAQAMELIMDGKSTADAVFFAAVESTNDCYDKDFAEAYGLAHWDELSTEACAAWGWVFGSKSKASAFKASFTADYYENKILAAQERDELI